MVITSPDFEVISFRNIFTTPTTVLTQTFFLSSSPSFLSSLPIYLLLFSLLHSLPSPSFAPSCLSKKTTLEREIVRRTAKYFHSANVRNSSIPSHYLWLQANHLGLPNQQPIKKQDNPFPSPPHCLTYFSCGSLHKTKCLFTFPLYIKVPLSCVSSQVLQLSTVGFLQNTHLKWLEINGCAFVGWGGVGA